MQLTGNQRHHHNTDDESNRKQFHRVNCRKRKLLITIVDEFDTAFYILYILHNFRRLDKVKK